MTKTVREKKYENSAGRPTLVRPLPCRVGHRSTLPHLKGNEVPKRCRGPAIRSEVSPVDVDQRQRKILCMDIVPGNQRFAKSKSASDKFFFITLLNLRRAYMGW